MWIQLDTKHDGIACVPTASRTSTVEEHNKGAGDAWGFAVPGSKRQNGQRGWCNPTHRSGNPRPAGFGWIEPDLPIGGNSRYMYTEPRALAPAVSGSG